MTHPKVGVAVFVLRDGKILMQKRKGAHGSGTWSLPGGHLEFGEAPEQAALREAREEAGITLTNIRAGPYTNDVFGPDKHYITLFFIAEADGEPKLMEPEWSEGWAWHDWDMLPAPLFSPIVNLLKMGFDPRKIYK